MKHYDNQFTIEEIERLCQLYLDCQLSVLEETELEYVLTQCDFKSPIINETKELMSISHSVKFAETRKTRGSFWTWWMSTAACVAIALGTFTLFHHFNNSNKNSNNDYCIVYVSGKRVNDEEAHKIAEADVAKMQQFMQTVNEQKAQEEAKVEQFMNHINQSK
ncbi:MAG: hypothetical protein IKW83_01875 [Muribaculaceae bacterium]|nr:hypothetical protein [Muribaculaceae bacterium]